MGRAARAAALAALLLALAGGAAAQAPAPAPATDVATAAADAPPPGPTIHHIVCTSDFPPMSTCNATSDPLTYSGFDIELFRRTASAQGWTETTNDTAPGTTYEFYCMPFGDMIKDLYTPGGNCTLATAGITISSEREAKGIRFSYPTYRSSLAIMVYAQEAGADAWFFFKPFTWEVWLALVLTVLAIPVVTLLTEFISIEGRVRRRDVVPGLKEAGWRSAWCMLLMEPFQVTSVSSRIVGILYGFLATVVINTYCANLAAFLTVNQLQTTIRGVDDLRGKAVGTIPVYVPRLGKYGIAPSELPFDGAQDAFTDWLPKLRSGVLVATAIDEPVQRYVAAEAGCNFRIVGDFAPFDFGLAWSVRANQSEVSEFDTRILKLTEDGTVSQLRNTFINVDRSQCDRGVSDTSAISFQQVSGLWIILAAGVGLALLWLIALRLWVWRERRARARAREAAAAASKLDYEAGRLPVEPSVGADSLAGSLPPASRQASARRRGGGGYKAGVAFRQTVSIFGAQIGAARHEKGAARREAAAAEQEAGWMETHGSGQANGLPPVPGSPHSPHPAAAGPADPSVAALLASVRLLCERLEAQGGGSDGVVGGAGHELGYLDDHGRRVVDERIEEAPEAD